MKVSAGQNVPFLAHGTLLMVIALFLGSLPAPAQTLQQLQRAYLDMRFGVFLHFNMSTFARQEYVFVLSEWEKGNESNDLFNPMDLDCGQWADAIRDAGARYAILTVKHHGGFCLWQTSTTTHGVGNCSWRDGKGDVVRDFVDSMSSRGLKVGFFYSIWDRNYPGGATLDLCKRQLTELLTNYGPVTIIWCDGWGWKLGYKSIPYDSIKTVVKSLQPNCLLLDNNHEKNLNHTEIVSFERAGDGLPPPGNTIPSETCFNITTKNVWFYHPTVVCGLHDAAAIVDDLRTLNSRNTNMLLNVTPTDTGTIPVCQVARLKQVQAAWGVDPVKLPTTVITRRRKGASDAIKLTYSGSTIMCTITNAMPFSLTVLDATGRCRLSFVGAGPGKRAVSRDALIPGLYVATVRTPGATVHDSFIYRGSISR